MNEGVAKTAALLAQSGILSKEDIREVVSISDSLKLPVYKALIMSGVMKEKEAANVHRAYMLITKSALPPAVAAEALKISTDTGSSFDCALYQMGWMESCGVWTNLIGPPGSGCNNTATSK